MAYSDIQEAYLLFLRPIEMQERKAVRKVTFEGE